MSRHAAVVAAPRSAPRRRRPPVGSPAHAWPRRHAARRAARRGPSVHERPDDPARRVARRLAGDRLDRVGDLLRGAGDNQVGGDLAGDTDGGQPADQVRFVAARPCLLLFSDSSSSLAVLSPSTVSREPGHGTRDRVPVPGTRLGRGGGGCGRSRPSGRIGPGVRDGRRGGEAFDARRRVEDIARELVAAGLLVAQLLMQHEAALAKPRQVPADRVLAHAEVRGDSPDIRLGHEPPGVVQARV